MIPESESHSGIRIGIKAWFVGIGIGIWTHDAGIGIEVFWETLESESESESPATGIGIMDFGKPWNRNQPLWNRNHKNL